MVGGATRVMVRSSHLLTQPLGIASSSITIRERPLVRSCSKLCWKTLAGKKMIWLVSDLSQAGGKKQLANVLPKLATKISMGNYSLVKPTNLEPTTISMFGNCYAGIAGQDMAPTEATFIIEDVQLARAGLRVSQWSRRNPFSITRLQVHLLPLSAEGRRFFVAIKQEMVE